MSSTKIRIGTTEISTPSSLVILGAGSVRAGGARLRTGLLAPEMASQGTAVSGVGSFGAHVVGAADGTGSAAGPRRTADAKPNLRTPHPSVRWSDDL